MNDASTLTTDTIADTGRSEDWVRAMVARFGGRFSSQVGIDVDDGDAEIERWFLASTLFGNRVDSHSAARTFRVLDGLGLSSLHDVASCDRDELLRVLEHDGYVRHDYRTTSRLLTLAENARRVLPDGASALGRRFPDVADLRVALETLPGWGPLTARTFLRELRGTWTGADLPIDPLAARAASHVGLVKSATSFDGVELERRAAAASIDVRDLEAALVRIAFAHHRSFEMCETRSPHSCELIEIDRLRDRPRRRSTQEGLRVIPVDSRSRSFPRCLP